MSGIEQQAPAGGFALTSRDGPLRKCRSSSRRSRFRPRRAGLRVSVLPGGCSGFKYSLNIEERPLDDDLVAR